MNASERELLNRLIEAFTRVESVGDARRSVLELLSEHMAASAHLVELDPLARGVLHDIRHGPLFRGTGFSGDLTKFLWCNPVLPHLPRIRELRLFRQREIVGSTLWYQSTYYNEFFKKYHHDDSVVMMFQRSSYAYASVSPRHEATPARTVRFLNYLHPLIENGLLNLKQWDDRWLSAGAVQHFAEATQDAVAAVRNGKLLAATGPARAILGLAQHGEASNVWLKEFLALVVAATQGQSGVYLGSDGRPYRVSVMSAPYADDGTVLLARFEVAPRAAEAVQAAQAAEGLDSLGEKAKLLGLSAREAAVMALAVQGVGARKIALDLGMAYNTARAHLRNAYAKLGVSNRVEAINRIRAADEVEK